MPPAFILILFSQRQDLMPALKAHLADWILPVAQPPLQNGAVVVDEQEQIVYVGPHSNMPSATEVVEHRKAALLPGLINAHTHLEFSDLTEPLGERGMPFTQWISAVVEWRMKNGVDKASAIAAGIMQSQDYGVAAIGEIASLPVDAKHYAAADRCQIHAFQEMLGADQSQYDEKLSQLDANTKSLQAAGVIPAVSPHAPYSVPPLLLTRLTDFAVSSQQAVAMHVAETMEEREFVEHRSGPFVEMLKAFGVWQPDLYRQTGSILEILQSLSRASRALIVHGNYLNEKEMDFIASKREKMSVVFCPRTHEYFGHTKYPIAEILERGINLAVGTDSRASNPDLNLLSELKEIRRKFPDLESEVILKIGNNQRSEGAWSCKSTGDD